MLNLALLLEQSSAREPDKLAVMLDEEQLTYADLDAAANRVAGALVQLGVQPGDKVALLLPNIPEFPICYYGILKAGAVVVPLNVLFKHSEIAYHLEDSDAVVLIAWEHLMGEAAAGFHQSETCKQMVLVQSPGSTQPLPHGAQSLHELVADQPPLFDTMQTMPDDTAVILYTSGTTGRPRGAELTHFNMFFNALVSATALDITENDVGLVALPLFHALGQTCMMNLCFYLGATITLLPHFEPTRAFEIITRDRVSYFAGVPTMYFYLLHHPEAEAYDLHGLQRCISGGAALPVEVKQTFKQRHGVTIQECYGLSETSPVATLNYLDEETHAGRIGHPVWGVELRLVDPEGQPLAPGDLGEIVIRGHNVMKGYYKRPEATAEVMRGGWLHTGDLGRMDATGSFSIVDRLKDVIIRGGMNVYPREIEEVLQGHPAIAEAAVIGVPHPALGEEILAVVVRRRDQAVSAEALINYCAERLAAFKYPRSIEFRDALPKTLTGKLLKHDLKAQVRAVAG
jgi:long-chain acyl-CoA synthetase